MIDMGILLKSLLHRRHTERIDNTFVNQGDKLDDYAQQQDGFVLIFSIHIHPSSRYGNDFMLSDIDEDRFTDFLFLDLHEVIDHFEWRLVLTSVQLNGQLVACPGSCIATFYTGVHSLVDTMEDNGSIHICVLDAQYKLEARIWTIDCN